MPAALILMIQFMTRYPVPGLIPFTAGHFVQGMRWMPLVGLLIGVPVALGMLAGSALPGNCLAAICTAVLFARTLIRKIGGITGDTIGATIELCETGVLFLFYLLWRHLT